MESINLQREIRRIVDFNETPDQKRKKLFQSDISSPQTSDRTNFKSFSDKNLKQHLDFLSKRRKRSSNSDSTSDFGENDNSENMEIDYVPSFGRRLLNSSKTLNCPFIFDNERINKIVFQNYIIPKEEGKYDLSNLECRELVYESREPEVSMAVDSDPAMAVKSEEGVEEEKNENLESFETLFEKSEILMEKNEKYDKIKSVGLRTPLIFNGSLIQTVKISKYIIPKFIGTVDLNDLEVRDFIINFGTHSEL